MRVTRKPVTPQQVEIGAKVLWDHHREEEGRVEWEGAFPWAREPYELRSQLVLEAVMPLDERTLREVIVRCEEAIGLI